jgi:hypothetical protein
MQKREQLTKQYEGEALANQIERLQGDVFGEVESKVILNEEESGYFVLIPRKNLVLIKPLLS